MASKKDKDYHILRNPEKYGMNLNTYDIVDGKAIDRIPTKERAEAIKAYEKLHNKYGGKSMVADKRRRNSTRKSNQRNKKTMSRKRRAQEKNNVQSLINDKDVDIKSKGGKWGFK